MVFSFLQKREHNCSSIYQAKKNTMSLNSIISSTILIQLRGRSRVSKNKLLQSNLACIYISKYLRGKSIGKVIFFRNLKPMVFFWKYFEFKIMQLWFILTNAGSATFTTKVCKEKMGILRHFSFVWTQAFGHDYIWLYMM